MDLFSTRLSKTLREKLSAVAHDETVKLTRAVPPDYAAFRERIGVVKGFTAALEILSEIEKELSQAEKTENLPIYTKPRYDE